MTGGLKIGEKKKKKPDCRFLVEHDCQKPRSLHSDAKLNWHTFIKYNNFLKLKKKESFVQFQIAFLSVFNLRTAGEYEQVQTYFYFSVNPKCLSFVSK